MGLLKLLKKFNQKILKLLLNEDNPKWKAYERILSIIEGIMVISSILIFVWHFIRQESPEQPIIIVKSHIENRQINESG